MSKTSRPSSASNGRMVRSTPVLGQVTGHLDGVDAAGGHELCELAEGDGGVVEAPIRPTSPRSRAASSIGRCAGRAARLCICIRLTRLRCQSTARAGDAVAS